MNLTFLEQDIIELLIFQPRCACEVADELSRDTDDILTALEGLKDRDLVRGEECGDVFDMAHGTTEHDPSPWEYCGGPVSEFFNYKLSKGVEDGRRLYA